MKKTKLPPIKNYHHRSRLTDDLIEMVSAKVREIGTVPARALVAAGIPESTAYEWLNIGAGEHSRYPDPPARYRKLHDATSQALMDWHDAQLARIGTDGHWKERSNVLGARFPEYRDQPPAKDLAAHPVQVFLELIRSIGNEPKAIEARVTKVEEVDDAVEQGEESGTAAPEA